MHDVSGRTAAATSTTARPDPRGVPPALPRAGMRPGTKELLETGGLNPTMYNAELEGGPRNGVMTALEDFIAELRPPGATVVVPVYFGLAIVVDESGWTHGPSCAPRSIGSRAATGRRELLELAESTGCRRRCSSSTRRSSAASRRLTRAGESLPRAAQVGAARRALPRARAPPQVPRALRDERRAGRARPCPRPDPRATGRVRAAPAAAGATGTAAPLDARQRLPAVRVARTGPARPPRTVPAIVHADAVPGDLVECGTGRGGAGIFMRGYLDAHELPTRKVWVADEFRATPAPAQEATTVDEDMPACRPTSTSSATGSSASACSTTACASCRAPSAQTLPDGRHRRRRPAPARRGRRRSRPSRARGALPEAGRRRLRHRRRPRRPGVRAGGRRLPRRTTASATPLEAVDWSAVAWRKTEPSQAPARRAGVRPRPPRWACRSPRLRRPDAIDLSVVVVFYNMRREAARTLHSLSRAYQQGIDDLDYEVIVVENGSDPDQKLGAEFVESFGPEFRYIDLGDDAQPSPSHALNLGLQEGRGKNIALMIDGAHVLTPSVLRYGLAGLATYEPAIVATQQWYVGPGQQPDAMSDGYDQAYEDRLFARIEWPEAGYRLFDIGHFIGDRDWFDGLWESNCIFVPRTLLEQVGRLRRELLDAGRRLRQPRALRAARLVTRRQRRHDPRRGSFHQVHGGTTTNQADADERHSRIVGYAEHFADLRGRRFRGPGKPIHYVGRIRSRRRAARRPRRLTATSSGRRSRRRRARRAADHADPDPRGPPHRLHRRVLAQPRVEAHDVARPAHRERAHRPRRVPGDHRHRAARLDHRDRHRQRRPHAVPRVDLRAARTTARSSRSTRTWPKDSRCIRASPTSTARATTTRPSSASRALVRRAAARSWCSGAESARRRHAPALRDLRAAGVASART